MSWRWRGTILFALTGLALLSLQSRAIAQPWAHPQDEAAAAIEMARGLVFSRPVPALEVSRDELQRGIAATLEKERDLEKDRAIEATLKLLGVLPPQVTGSDLEKEGASRVLGYYDPDAGQLFILSNAPESRLRGVRLHETVHALQDQKFDLKRLRLIQKNATLDQALAIRALIEGDATWTMVEALGRGTRAERILEDGPEPAAGTLGDWKLFLARERRFPYREGARFVKLLKEAHGWEGVNRAYEDLPLSSQQVIHPDTYLAREAPAKVELPEVTGYIKSGYRTLMESRAGEYYTYLLLSHYLPEAMAKNVSPGWRGDRFATLARSGKVLFLWRSAWEDEPGADRFYAAYSQLMEARTGTGGREGPRGITWLTEEGLTVVRREGRNVFVAHGLPD